MSFWRARRRPRSSALLWAVLFEALAREACASVLRELDPTTPAEVQRAWAASATRKAVTRVVAGWTAPPTYAPRTARVRRRFRRVAPLAEVAEHGHGCRFCGGPWTCTRPRCRLPRNALCGRCYSEWRADERAATAAR